MSSWGIGPWVPKWTYLLNNVTVTGTVQNALNENGVRDPTVLPLTYGAIDLLLDANYQHLTSSFNGPPPNANAPGGVCAPSPGPLNAIHCEAYTENITTDPPATKVAPQTAINVFPDGVPWNLPTPNPYPGVAQVYDPSIGGTRNLMPGDHIQLTGVWLIENGHPMACWNPGIYKVGAVWPELHPFLWTALQVVPTGPPVIVNGWNNSYNTQQVSVAAPLYQWLYPDSWAANNIPGNRGNCIFTDFNPPNIFNSVTANATIPAPQLPSGFHGDPNLIACYETITDASGIGSLGTSGISRSWSPSSDGLSAEVTVTVTDPNTLTDSANNPIPNPNDPANGISVYQGNWSVGWLPRLTAQTTRWVYSILNRTTPFTVWIGNNGPDDLTLQSPFWTVFNPGGHPILSGPSVFTLDSGGVVVPAYATVIVNGTFTPNVLGQYTAYLSIPSNDPADTINGYPNLQITVFGSGYLLIPIIVPQGYHGTWPMDFHKLNEESIRAMRKLKKKPYVAPDLGLEEPSHKTAQKAPKKSKRTKK